MDEVEYAAGISGKVPRYLHKYKSLAGHSKKYTRDLIVNQRLYFPGPSELNDPFEFKPNLETAATDEQQSRYAFDLVSRTHLSAPRAERRRIAKEMVADRVLFRDNIRRSTVATLQSAGVFSMSARHLDLLMWPHYADNHRGVCIRFDMETLLDTGHVPFRVNYANERPTCDTILEPTVEWVNKAVLTKGKPWEYEEEWRLVENRGAGTTIRMSAPAINGVLLGANISPADRAEVLQWVKEADRPIGVAQAKFHSSSYELELENVI